MVLTLSLCHPRKWFLNEGKPYYAIRDNPQGTFIILDLQTTPG